MLNTHFNHALGSDTLHRYPAYQHDPSLQAFDAVDEFLLAYLIEHFPKITNTEQKLNIAIFNDDFGALSLTNQTQVFMVVIYAVR